MIHFCKVLIVAFHDQRKFEVRHVKPTSVIVEGVGCVIE